MLTWKQLPFIDRVKSNAEAFGKKVIAIADALNVSPNWLMVVINNESAGTFSPSVHNPTSSATGLIQFMAATASGLGTTTQALASMTAVQQLDYVKKYLAPHAKKIKDVSDLYLAVFYPAALDVTDENWRFPAWAASANPIFDVNKDGTLTKGEFRQYVNNKYAKYLNNGFELLYGKKKSSS